MNRLIIALLLSASSLHAADALVKLVLGSASAKANATLKPGSTFTTGKKSKSEVALEGGTVRTGSDTTLQIGGPDSLSLKKGIALVASKKKLFGGGVNLDAPGYGLKVHGTAQVYYDPGHSIRIVVLDGDLTVALASVRGEKVKLKRGQELIMNPIDKQLPVPVEVDLNRLMTTMALLDQSKFEPLPSHDSMVSAAHQQQEELVSGEELDATGIVMESAAPELEVRPEELVHEEIRDELSDLDGDGQADPAAPLDEDGVPIEGDAANGDVVIEGTPVADDGTGSGNGAASAKKGGAGGKTTKSKFNAIALSGRQISGNRVRIGSAATPSRIQITNSSQVAALAGDLQILNKGGSIAIDASTLRSSRQILIDGSASTPGLLSIKDATLNAQVIRARAFSLGGDALVIDGSTLNADQLIKLYAEGASTLRFRNTVTLNTNQAIIAGKIVEVDAGGNVNVRGRADVFTDDARFNREGYGNINAGGGLTTSPHKGRPGF